MEAIRREKQIKAGPRWRKVSLIESANPEWKDLAEGLGN
jgi:putative endonuclease